VPRRDFGAGSSGALDFGGNWRASAFLGGSPGRADPEPDTTIVLNEVVAHTDDPSGVGSNDWVELHNTGAGEVVLGPGWYLSDDPDNLRRWAIPDGTRIAGGGWVVFDEATGFNTPRGSGFSLDKDGEQVFLSRFPAAGPGGVVDAVAFAGQENDWAWARVPDGGAYWDAVQPRTPGGRVGGGPPRVVISELLYHEAGLPAQGLEAEQLEYVEVHNAAGSAVPLYDAIAPWRVRGGIDFDFAPGFTLAPGERMLLVSFDPVHEGAVLQAFRNVLNVPVGTRVLGPYAGRLDNDTDRVNLQRVQAPDLPGEPPSWVVVDEVDYFDRTPWPGGADGTGNSYHRLSPTLPGMDPSNWRAAAPSPGAGLPGPDPALDTDADGMPDAWEILHGFAPGDPADAVLDADGDGLDNRSEFRAGTHPRDASDRLAVSVVRGLEGGVVDLVFTAVGGRGYVVELRDPAQGGAWTTVGTVESGVGNRSVRVPVAVDEGVDGRWFRVRLAD
jgi:hypothetical protein